MKIIIAILWVDEKITPDQPFAAKVIAAGGISPWLAKTHIYLQEIGKKKRYCLATIYLTHLPKKIIDYKILEEFSILECSILADPIMHVYSHPLFL